MRFHEVHLSTKVRHALKLLAKAKFPTGDTEQIMNASCEIADKMLRQVITEKYPEVWEHLRQEDKLKKEFLNKCAVT